MKLTSQNSLPYSFVPLKPFQPPTIFFCSQHTEKTPKKEERNEEDGKIVYVW